MAMSRRESFSIRFIPYSPKKLRYDDSRSSFVTLACSKPSRSSCLIRHFIKEGQNGRTE
ncbi:hypothetical protein BDN70DRAFT_875942 [Pholiota conissans]|uniref:Uncharacterized protein n=1 Tax=Pholiota conissans TaxID=109636 RepID=A0A9P5Z6M7_9AGAR|nr:hypothetical protein BDN70DRAFT_875942 [Pholiota conissans]